MKNIKNKHTHKGGWIYKNSDNVARSQPLKRNFGLDCGPRAKKDIRLGVSDETKTGMERVDFNGDGVVNFDDFVLMDAEKNAILCFSDNKSY